MARNKREASHMKLPLRIAALATSLIFLAGCSVTAGNKRPEDAKLRDGIKLLITQFEEKHPDLINWKKSAVETQISSTMPDGYATEAGWTIVWKQATNGQFSRVVVPWLVLGQLPDNFASDTHAYTGGKTITYSQETNIRALQQKGDSYFAAVVHIRQSTIDPTWYIFESIPYLPVTDNAYGFAHKVNGKTAITDFGTATVGCGRVPEAVEKEFGFSCP